MFNIEVAGLVITIENRYDYVRERCSDYITDRPNNTGITLCATDEKIQYSIDFKLRFDGVSITLPEAEFDAIHYHLYEQLHNYDAFWLHSVLIEKNGEGYAFTAAPGVGKSTHAKLWLEAFPDAAIVNGDNPIIRREKEDGVFYGYGTPFCGKEGYNKNSRVPIKAICFLERAETNYVEVMNSLDATIQMLKDNWWVRYTAPREVMNIYLDMAEQVKFYRLHCNMDIDAAKVAFAAMNTNN